MDTQAVKNVRTAVAANSADGYLSISERESIVKDALSDGAGDVVNSIIQEECIKYGIIDEQVISADIYDYIKKKYSGKKLSKKDAETIQTWAKGRIPKDNRNKSSAEQQLIAKTNELIGPIASGPSTGMVIGFAVAVVLAIGVPIFIVNKPSPPNPPPVPIPNHIIPQPVKPLTPSEKQQIDNQISLIITNIDAGQYTDPPENCAKMHLDAIRHMDPNFAYKKEEIESLIEKIIGKYLQLAHTDYNSKNMEGVKKWVGRAKLFYKESERIRDFEKDVGLINAVE